MACLRRLGPALESSLANCPSSPTSTAGHGRAINVSMPKRPRSESEVTLEACWPCKRRLHTDTFTPSSSPAFRHGGRDKLTSITSATMQPSTPATKPSVTELQHQWAESLSSQIAATYQALPSPPDIVLDDYSDHFGEMVCIAWQKNQRKSAQLHGWRVNKYGEEAATCYPPGDTPDDIIQLHQRKEEDMERAWEEDRSSDDEESNRADSGKGGLAPPVQDSCYPESEMEWYQVAAARPLSTVVLDTSSSSAHSALHYGHGCHDTTWSQLHYGRRRCSSWSQSGSPRDPEVQLCLPAPETYSALGRSDIEEDGSEGLPRYRIGPSRRGGCPILSRRRSASF